MSDWRPARAITTLRNEVNDAAPDRSKASDGIIGDAAHSDRTSDHNPNSRGVVRAFDITHDPDDGVDGNELAAELAAMLGQHPALASGAYIIWNWRIISTDRLDESWRRYLGVNGHTKHVHVSVGRAISSYDSTRAWGVLEHEPRVAVPPSLRRAVDNEMQAFLRVKAAGRGTAAEVELGRIRDYLRTAKFGRAEWEALIREMDSLVRHTPARRRKELAGRRRNVAQARHLMHNVVRPS